MPYPTLYQPAANSPRAALAADINETVTSLTVVDGSKLPEAPNYLTIGTDEDAETVLMTYKNADVLTVERGKDGSTAKEWVKGQSIARYFTAADHRAIIEYLEMLNAGKTSHNLSINPLVPGGTVNQRGKTTYNTVGQYSADRKKLMSGSTTVSGSGTSCTMTLNGTVREIIENPGIHAGQIITASIEDGEVSVGVNGNQTSFAPSVTVTLPTTLTSLFVEIKAAGTIPKRLQITYGSERLPFVPRSIGEELALCQRYYEKSYAISVAPGSVTAPGSLIFVTLAVNTTTSIPFNFRKRATPSVVIYNPVTGEANSIRNSTATANVAGVTASSIGDGSIGYVTTPNQTAPWSGSLHWTADAEL